MKKKKYASESFPLSGNIGDPIQTLAAERFLPRTDYRIDWSPNAADVTDVQKLLRVDLERRVSSF